MFKKFLLLFGISMIPMVELRGAVILAAGMDIPAVPALLVCMIGNMIPVPFIYFFARKVLIWGADKRYIGKFFRFCLEKGERGGQKLVAKTGRGGLFVALMLFVGIPLPGTGAWTGTLAASFLNMGIKSTTVAVTLGVATASAIMYLISAGAFAVFGII
ncbi:MAG: small multi-drug export protein [Oscillospiraceae bacterium]|nr:small multi-drug export protein [Oscillospiraceae bacterium]